MMMCDAKYSVGSTFPTPLGGILTVTEILPKGKLVCTCSVCSLDEELWPKGSIVTHRNTLKAGGSSCGCTKSIKWSSRQTLLRCQREADKRGDIIIQGFSEPYRGNKTKLQLLCKEEVCCSYSESVSVDKFLSGRGCPACGDRRSVDSSRKEWVGLTRRSCKEGFVEVVEDLKTDYIKVSCTKCAEDPELYGDGTFTMLKDMWTSGYCGCGCSPCFKKTKEQYTVLLHRRELEVQGKVKFIDFVGEWDGCDTYIEQECLSEKHHLNWSSGNITNALHGSRGCPECAKGVYGYYVQRDNEEDNLYLLRFCNKEEEFIKVGRAFNITERLKYFPLDIYTVEVLDSFQDIHKNVSQLERFSHQELEEFHYKPITRFGGSVQECFDMRALGTDYLNNIFNFSL